MSGFLAASDKYLVAPDLHFKRLQRTRRRAGNVTTVDVILAVMAGAPDLARVITILHGARKVRAGGRHGLILAGGGTDQQSRAAAEAKHLAAIRLQLASLCSDDGAAAHVRFL